MPQLSPISWILVSFLLITMIVNGLVSSWWCTFGYYYVNSISMDKIGSNARMFVWGKQLKKL